VIIVSAEREEIIELIDTIIDRVKDKAVDWWWLEQGKAPIIKITIFEKAGNEVTLYESPKLSLIAALRKIRDNFRELDKCPQEDKFKILRRLYYDFSRIQKALTRIIEVDQILKEHDYVISRLSQMSDEAESLRNKVFSLINSIRDSLLIDDDNWALEINKFIKELNQIKKEMEEFIIRKEEKRLVMVEKSKEKEVMMEGA